jgi:hypothetical protein
VAFDQRRLDDVAHQSGAQEKCSPALSAEPSAHQVSS